MKTLIDEMHLHINDIEEDELTQHKKREKKLMATLEHAMDGMKLNSMHTTHGRAKSKEVVKLVHTLQQSSMRSHPCKMLDTLIDWVCMNVRSYNVNANQSYNGARWYQNCEHREAW